MEVCKNAESISPIKSLFPDEEKVHYLAVFDKTDMDRMHTLVAEFKRMHFCIDSKLLKYANGESVIARI